ncbi:xanthine dehydrogenase molybdopterin binding subunit [Adhaeribacter soli]|uniref:Molybdopterin-dependent oxidoreductase n=1 Tax=Adhaeribacter soli TaxID=2607655 RepID=A0A5N1J2C6_9BACT|nr:molybdopterin cofactor-binding domain-containing protein [Adhaeribacter soli]KAA9340739.1 molybdopterin-dependent oxidoreductase [Adhaeribacter soli]
MRNIDAFNHVRGESVYLDDIAERQGTLHAWVFGSQVAHGKILSLDTSAAENMPGVYRILTAADIPGENQIGGIIADEPLLAEGEVHFWGQPVAIVLAETEAQAQEAAHKIVLEVEKLPVIIDPREAQKVGSLIMQPRTFHLGDPETGFAECEYIFEGVAENGGQEHLYIETQGAYAWPKETGSIYVASSTQGPTAVQRHTAHVLGIGMSRIEVDVTRLGGGFGGKEDQATPWAVMACLGAFLTKRPVKLVLHRMEDMRMTGKRHPYSSDFKIGLDKDFKIKAYEVTFYQNAGAAADLSPAVMERTLFHATNSYFIPNVRATAYSCKTNLPPNTAFRGFGGPQGMFVIESAIAFAAEKLGVAASVIQKANLLKEGDEFPYGQHTEGCEAENCWQTAESRYNLEQLREEVNAFNRENTLLKKGMALMPICFGISFTKTAMNQARALVHIYTDGSVGVSTGAVEMGQAVNTKMLQVAAQVLGINPNRIRIETTNTTRVANTSPSAASATADLNGKAVQMACENLLERLKAHIAIQLNLEGNAAIEIQEEQVLVNGKTVDLPWEKLVFSAYWSRLSLSENAHYATPDIHFNPEKEKGYPFAYHVYGTAIFTVTVDCLRGTYDFDSVKIAHDFGSSMNTNVDLGQIEGGLVQGIGWMTLEELIFNQEGRLLSNALSTYKVPDIYSVPKEVEVHFMDTPGSPRAIFGSKAVGEPPLMYGIGAFFALRNAIKAFRPEAEPAFVAPMTPEKVLLNLYPEFEAAAQTASVKENAL